MSKKKMLSDEQCQAIWENRTVENPLYIDSEEGKQVMDWVARMNKAMAWGKSNTDGRDPTIHQEIMAKGGIKSSVDGKVYTSESAYKQHLKDSGHHIKDYDNGARSAERAPADMHLDFSKP